MRETVFNLFLYLEGEIIKSIGAVPHDFDGDEHQAMVFLRNQAGTDASRAAHFPLPVADIKLWIGVDAQAGLSHEIYSYISRTGKAMWLFDELLQNLNAPNSPIVCITAIADGKPRIDVIADVDSSTCAETLSDEFGGTVIRIDWLAAYVTPSGLNVHDLLHDDFTKAIKLLYAHGHYVSAMKLIVSFIDTVAYLHFGDVSGNYEMWLSKHVVLGPVGVTPSELWEFRNSILHMTNPHSRKVLSGKVLPLGFRIDPAGKSVRIDAVSGTKVFSFVAFYDAIIEGVDKWTSSYSGDLSRQLEFIRRYDTVLSEGRVGKLGAKRQEPGRSQS